MYESERAEKMKVEEEYSVLKKDVNDFFNRTTERAMKQNYEKIMSGEMDLEDELKKLKKEKKIWEEEKKSLKEEKKKLEYTMFELVKAGHAHKDKLKKISEICHEWEICVLSVCAQKKLLVVKYLGILLVVQIIWRDE